MSALIPLPHPNDCKEPASLCTWSFFVISLSNFLMFLSFHMLLPVLPLYLIKHLGIEAPAAGVIMAAYVGSATLSRPIAGFIADVCRGKRLLIISYTFFGLCFGGYFISSDPYFLFFLRLLHGLAFGMVTTASVVYALEVIPKSRLGSGISFFGVSANLSMALGPMLSLSLLQGYTYTTVFAACCVFAVLSFIMVLFTRVLPPVPVENRPTFSVKELWVPVVKENFIEVWGTAFMFGVVANFTSLFIATHQFEMNAGYFFFFFALGTMSSRLGGGRFIDRGYTVQSALYGKICILIGAFVLIHAGEVWVLCAAAVSMGLGFGLYSPAVQTMFTTLVPSQKRGRANSLFFTGFDGGIGLALLSCGLVIDVWSVDATYWLGCGVSILSLVYFVLVVGPHYNRNKVI